jgi:hypothetical protein
MGLWVGIAIGFLFGMYFAWDLWLEGYDREDLRQKRQADIKCNVPLKMHGDFPENECSIQHFADYIRTEHHRLVVYKN